MVQATFGCREPEIITVPISACRMRQNAERGRQVLPAVILTARIITVPIIPAPLQLAQPACSAPTATTWATRISTAPWTNMFSTAVQP